MYSVGIERPHATPANLKICKPPQFIYCFEYDSPHYNYNYYYYYLPTYYI